MRRGLGDRRIGEVALFECRPSIVDLQSMLSMAPDVPTEAMFPGLSGKTLKNAEKALGYTMASFENYPIGVVMRGKTPDGHLCWASIKPEFLRQSPVAIAYRYGIQTPERWQVVAIVDAVPGESPPSDKLWPVTLPAELFIGNLKKYWGRTEKEYAVSPIAIYRPVQ